MKTEARKKYQLEWQRKNRERVAGYNHKWRINNPARIARNYLMKTYGFTEQQAEVALVSQQGDFCASCGDFDLLVVDHNHSTGKPRGMVCQRCNQITGALEDPKLARVRTYLEEAI